MGIENILAAYVEWVIFPTNPQGKYIYCCILYCPINVCMYVLAFTLIDIYDGSPGTTSVLTHFKLFLPLPQII